LIFILALFKKSQPKWILFKQKIINFGKKNISKGFASKILYQFHVINKWISMLPSLRSITWKGFCINLLRMIQIIQSLKKMIVKVFQYWVCPNADLQNAYFPISKIVWNIDGNTFLNPTWSSRINKWTCPSTTNYATSFNGH